MFLTKQVSLGFTTPIPKINSLIVALQTSKDILLVPLSVEQLLELFTNFHIPSSRVLG